MVGLGVDLSLPPCVKLGPVVGLTMELVHVRVMPTIAIVCLLVFTANLYAPPPIDGDDLPDRYVQAGKYHQMAYVQSYEDAPAIRTSHPCLQVVAGHAGWKNKQNKRFYNWLFRYAPEIFAHQREFCGVNECQDLDFLRDFFRFSPFPNNRLVPDELIQSLAKDVKPRNVLLIGAHPREVDWLVNNSSAGRIFAVEHAKEAVRVLKDTAILRKWPEDRVRIRKVSFLHNEFRDILTEMNDGEFPHLHFVFAMWSAFYEFNPREQELFLRRAHDLLPSPGGLVIDFLSDPMMHAETIGHKRVEIDVSKIDVDPDIRELLEQKSPPPPLHVYIPGKLKFLNMVDAAGFAASSSFIDSQSPAFLYNESRQARALYLFERRDASR